jgi:hypothetical protein
MFDHSFCLNYFINIIYFTMDYFIIRDTLLMSFLYLHKNECWFWDEVDMNYVGSKVELC